MFPSCLQVTGCQAMYRVPSNWLHTSISVSPLISYPSYFNSFRMPHDIKRLQVWWSRVFLERTQSTFRNFEWALLTGTNWPSWRRGWRRRSGLAKLKLCHAKRVRKGVGCFRSYWSHTGRESWIVLGCRLCYFMLPWRRNVRGMLFTCSFSLKLIEPTPDIAHYRKRV